MHPALGLAGLVLEAASLVWRGRCRDVHRSWKELYGEERPEELLIVRFYPRGRCCIERRDGTVEIRKVPGAEGPSALELTAGKLHDGMKELLKTVLGG